MPNRSYAVAALVAGAAALAAPAAASAAAPTVLAGPVKVKAYSMTVFASKGSLSVLLSRTAGRSTQTHFYSVARHVRFRVAHSLGSGTIKAPLGRFGKIRLKLRATGPIRKAKVPKGCKGSAGSSRKVKLTGKFALKADGGRYFGRIHKHSLPGQAFRSGNLKCKGSGTPIGPTPGPTSGTVLSRSFTQHGAFTSLFVARRKGKVTESVTRSDSFKATAPLSILHTISTPAPSGAFTVASDLSSATVEGAGRFLTGSLAFTADSAFANSATGQATGDLKARFDTLAPVSLTAGDAITSLFSG